MNMNTIRAVAQSSEEVGKKMAETKKKFKWIFMVNEDKYILQLISSLISGKKVIKLNDSQIYTEKDILNTKFDFSYDIGGHIIRLKRTQTSINLFDLFIDNYNFSEILDGNSYGVVDKSLKKISVEEENPFDNFNKLTIDQNIKSSVMNSQSDNQLTFGVFDFDEFNSQIQKIQNSLKKSQIKGKSQEQNQKPKIQLDSSQNEFAKRFTEGQQQFVDQQVFATNAFGNLSNFAELNKKEQQRVANKRQKVLQIQMLAEQAKNKLGNFADLWKKP